MRLHNLELQDATSIIDDNDTSKRNAWADIAVGNQSGRVSSDTPKLGEQLTNDQSAGVFLARNPEETLYNNEDLKRTIKRIQELDAAIVGDHGHEVADRIKIGQATEKFDKQIDASPMESRDEQDLRRRVGHALLSKDRHELQKIMDEYEHNQDCLGRVLKQVQSDFHDKVKLTYGGSNVEFTDSPEEFRERLRQGKPPRTRPTLAISAQDKANNDDHVLMLGYNGLAFVEGPSSALGADPKKSRGAAILGEVSDAAVDAMNQ